MMRAFLFTTFALVAGVFAQGSIHLKDGRIIPTKQMSRERDTINAVLEVPPKEQGGKPSTAGVGFPLTDIFKLDFPRPAILDSAPDLIAKGEAAEALSKLEPAVRYYGGFRDAPGSWWPDLVPLQIEAFLALKRDKDAIELAETFGRLATDPEIKRFTSAFTAVARTRRGQHEAALALYDEAVRSTERIDILGLVAVNRGESLLALADGLAAKGEVETAAVRYEEALLSFLRIPALYPFQRMYIPQATLGAGQAYLGMNDLDRARRAVKELADNFAGTPEAKASAELAKRIDRKAALLADPEPEKKSP